MSNCADTGCFGNMEPVIEWVAKIKGPASQSSVYEVGEIDYMLAEGFFLSLLAKGNHGRALTFAQTQLCKLALRLGFEDRLNNVMACLLYDVNSIPKDEQDDSMSYPNNSHEPSVISNPYAHYFSSNYRETLCLVLSKWVCEKWGLDLHSPLETCLTYGRLNLPAVLKTIEQMRMMSGQTGTPFSVDQELPMCMSAGNGDSVMPFPDNEGVRKAPCNCYHSRFVCPILKVQSTPDNPPVRLTCGHVISREAMTRIIMGTRLKCPYCNTDQHPNQVVELIL